MDDPASEGAPDTQPTVRQERTALETNPAALLVRIEDLERTRAIDAARIGVLEAQVRTLETGE